MTPQDLTFMRGEQTDFLLFHRVTGLLITKVNGKKRELMLSPQRYLQQFCAYADGKNNILLLFSTFFTIIELD